MKTVLAIPLIFFRLLYQSVYLALGQIWANKTRSILTTLGIVIGVASVTAVIAALTGLKAKILTQVETLGTNTIFISPRTPDRGRFQHAGWWQMRFRPEQMDGLLDHCPCVEALCRRGGVGWRTVKYGEQSVDRVEIQGIEPDFHKIEHRPVILGRVFSPIDDMQVRQVCLIDAKLRDKLRLDHDCIGETIRIGYNAFRIVGVIETRPQMNFGDTSQENYELFIPFRTLEKLGEPFMWAMATGKSADTLEEAQAEIRFFLRRTRGMRPGEPDNFRVESLQSALDTFNKIAVIVTLVAGGIVGISLLVGGVGIMNIMLVSVTERTREIGIRMAVGAKTRAIRMQFIAEALTLSLIGGVVGIIAGISVSKIISALAGWSTIISPLSILLAFGFSGLVGIFFGYYPAYKASLLNPIQALRYE